MIKEFQIHSFEMWESSILEKQKEIKVALMI
jgi:hypothetical protein